MLTAVFVMCILWFGFLALLAWFSAFNWLVTERVFPRDASVGQYILKFAATPIIISMIVVEGFTKKLLNYFGKES